VARSPSQHFHREEVGSGQYGQMRGDEFLPGSGLAAFRSRGDALPAKDVPHRLVGNLVAPSWKALPQCGRIPSRNFLGPCERVCQAMFRACYLTSSDNPPSARACSSQASLRRKYRTCSTGQFFPNSSRWIPCSAGIPSRMIRSIEAGRSNVMCVAMGSTP
jgi:hypothetical protein